MKRWLVLSLFFVLSACGIESFEDNLSLNAPLGLTATTNDSGNIVLSFWALNDEPYFEGYNIYIATSMQDALEDKGEKNTGAFRGTGNHAQYFCDDDSYAL